MMSIIPNIANGGGDVYRIDLYKGIFGPDMNITNTDPSNINDNTIIKLMLHY